MNLPYVSNVRMRRKASRTFACTSSSSTFGLVWKSWITNSEDLLLRLNIVFCIFCSGSIKSRGFVHCKTAGLQRSNIVTTKMPQFKSHRNVQSLTNNKSQKKRIILIKLHFLHDCITTQ